MAFFVARQAARRAFATTTRRLAAPVEKPDAVDKQKIKGESKRNPELWILAGTVICAFAGVGVFAMQSPTMGNNQQKVYMADDAMPWEGGRRDPKGKWGQGKYVYIPRGDSGADPKEAPSALNVVVVPDVTLPKHLHDKYNKWGKEDF